MPILALVLLLTSWPTLTAAFNANSYDFGMGQAFEKLCQTPKEWYCSAFKVEDFTPKKIPLLVHGWYELRRGRGGELLPLLQEIAAELRNLKEKPVKLEAVKAAMKNDLTQVVMNVIRLLVEAKSFVLAADLLAEVHESFNLSPSHVLKGKSVSSEFVAVVGLRHAQLIAAMDVDEHLWITQPHLAAAFFNDRSGDLLRNELAGMTRSRRQLNLFSLFLCWPIVTEAEEANTQHLKQLRSTIKVFARKLKEEDLKTEIMAQSDLCYGEDVSVAMKQLKTISSVTEEGRARIIRAGLVSNNQAISWAVADEILGTQLISFLGNEEERKALWPLVKKALSEFFVSKAEEVDKCRFLVTLLEYVLNSGRAREFMPFLLRAVREVNQPDPQQRRGRTRQQYHVEVRDVEGLRVILYHSELFSAISWYGQLIKFKVEGSTFAAAVLEDAERMKTFFKNQFGRWYSFDGLIQLERPENAFIYLGRPDQFSTVLEVLSECNELLDVKAFLLEQVKKIYRRYNYSYLNHPAESFILTSRPLLSFLKDQFSDEAMAQLPSQVTQILSEGEKALSL